MRLNLDIVYGYSIKLTEKEKREIDKQVRQNRFKLRFAILFPFRLF